MKTKFRGLAFTAMLLSGASITYAQNGSVVGDLPGYGEDAYFDEEATYASDDQVTPVSHAAPVSHSAPASRSVAASKSYAPRQAPQQYAPIPSNQLQPASFRLGGRSHMSQASSCESCQGCGSVACDGGCDSAYGMQRRNKLCSVFDRCNSDTWAQVEFLMWFTQDRDTPALVTTSDPGTLPVLPAGGADNVNVVFGNEINGELSAGFRGDVGVYLTENVGVGGRFWILAENNDSYFASGDGSSMSIGRPFFNSDTGAEDALLVALNGSFTGGVAAQSSLDILGAEAYARLGFSRTASSRVDFIGGYSHFEIDDTLRIGSTTIDNGTARTRTFLDQFEAENRFDGGQLGFEMVVTRGRWMARSLTKVHLGNMNQQVSISGVSTDQTPPLAATTTSGGLLALGNQGEYERDVFAFAPEANFKLAYRFRPNVLLSVGYSFIYWDNVALSGDAIDRVIDPTALNTGTFGTSPRFEFDDSSLWVQGLDLGVVIDF